MSLVDLQERGQAVTGPGEPPGLAFVPPRGSASDLGLAYRAARASRLDPALRSRLARRLLQAGRLEAARRHALAAQRLAGSTWPGLCDLGGLLYKLGLFEAAYETLVAGLRRDIRDGEALRLLSTLFAAGGREPAARRVLGAAARVEPISRPPRRDPRKPSLLRLRSFDNSSYLPVFNRKSGTYGRRLRGGHFSVKHLLSGYDANLYVASVSGDNLDRLAQVPDFDLAINTVSCPDLNPEALKVIDRFLQDLDPRRIINPPRLVLQTTRQRNAERLGRIAGLVFPRTEMFRNLGRAEELADRLVTRGFAFPLLLRLPGTQTGVSLAKLDDRARLVAYLKAAAQGQELYAIQYLDCRDGRGLTHKSRVFFIDGRLYPVASIASDGWQIHSADRYRVMDRLPELQEHERAFLADPRGTIGGRAYAALEAVGRTIGLDFCGVDFTLDAAGRLVVFEANAAMRHNFDHAAAFPYTRPHLERISRAFREMVDGRLAALAATR